ncbi:MAG: TIGR02300 family protein [Bradyrhizobium sp.]
MAKSDLGTKRICPTTGKKFYDLGKTPVISPYTGEVVPIAPIAPPRAARGDAARAAAAASAASAADQPEAAEVEEVSLEEADAEENSGKVKAAVPESEDDIEVDETIEDDDDDDSTFIPDEEEGDEDVTDIIGDVGNDEET